MRRWRLSMCNRPLQRQTTKCASPETTDDILACLFLSAKNHCKNFVWQHFVGAWRTEAVVCGCFHFHVRSITPSEMGHGRWSLSLTHTHTCVVSPPSSFFFFFPSSCCWQKRHFFFLPPSTSLRASAQEHDHPTTTHHSNTHARATNLFLAYPTCHHFRPALLCSALLCSVLLLLLLSFEFGVCVCC